MNMVRKKFVTIFRKPSGLITLISPKIVYSDDKWQSKEGIKSNKMHCYIC